MKKLAFLTHQLSNTQQQTTLYTNLNIISNNHRDLDLILFHSDLGQTTHNNNFPIMQSIEALDYDGILIATDLISAHLLSNCICTKKKYFYVWNIDWHINNRPSMFIKDIYLNPEINLIARSKDHAKLIDRVFKTPKYIIEEFNHEQIIENII